MINTKTKPLPWVKLFFAGLGLAVLVVGSKHLFAERSDNMVMGSRHDDNAGLLDNNNQTQPALTAPTNALPPASTSAATTVTAPAAAPSQNRLRISNTPTGYLNVRSQPSTSGQIIGKVYPGQIHESDDSQDGWYRIQLKSNQSGWVDGEYVTNDE